MRPVAYVRQELARTALLRTAPLLRVAAARWRSMLPNTKFVAVTGSLGKTTAKECLAAILSTRQSTFMSVGNQNAGTLLSLNLLRVRPWHRFAVIETAAGDRQSLRDVGRLVRPDVALIVSIALAHTSTFGTLDAIAQEKLSLLTGLTPSGVAVVNGDESRLQAAGATGACSVLRFGVAGATPPAWDLVAEQVQSCWPDRLRFLARSGTESQTVATRLVGAHWTPAVLAAILAAMALGFPLGEAAAAVARVDPHPARMQPVSLGDGVTCLRDDYNGAPESWDAAFAVMAAAQARRKVLVAGDFSDSRHGPRQRLQRMGRAAAEWARMAVFVGPDGHYSRKGAAEGGMDSGSIFHTSDWEQGAAWLKPRLQPGDLVLLKGRIHDHLARLLFALNGPVGCHQTQCRRRYLCDQCWRLGVPARRRVFG